MTDDPARQPRIYLDNAATSWPKPESVYRAVDDYQRRVGAPAGRSGYAEAVAVGHDVESARSEIARLVGLDDPAHLIFTANGTDSLNLVIHGLLRAGDHADADDAELDRHQSACTPTGVCSATASGLAPSMVSAWRFDGLTATPIRARRSHPLVSPIVCPPIA